MNHYPGIQIEKTKNKSFLLSQRHKIMGLAESLGMKNAKGASTSLEPDYFSFKDEVFLKSNQQQYREEVGKLLYLSTVSRPDFSAAVGILCRKTNLPNQYDWNALKRLARYLKRTADLKLKISACDNPRLVGYMNSDWSEYKTDFSQPAETCFSMETA